MRIIKFRAWDSKASPPQMYIDPYFSPPTNLRLSEAMEEISRDLGWIWMQSTGLLDSTGKEIYEWDILLTSSSVNDFKEQGVVTFNHGTFGISVIRNGELFFHDIWSFPAFVNKEIIGNVYQDPELLKENE